MATCSATTKVSEAKSEGDDRKRDVQAKRQQGQQHDLEAQVAAKLNAKLAALEEEEVAEKLKGKLAAMEGEDAGNCEPRSSDAVAESQHRERVDVPLPPIPPQRKAAVLRPALEPIEWDFVEDPPEITSCALCAEVMKEPQLPICCGQNHLCCSCIVRINEIALKRKEEPCCPFCRTENFQTMVSADLKNTILELKVRCIEKNSGCEWTGKIRDIENHLRKECQVHPIICPNECESKVQRKHLVQHLSECPLEMVQCPYNSVGCTEGVRRKDGALHMKDGIHQHLIKVSEKNANVLAECTVLAKSASASYDKMLKTRNSQIVALKQQISKAEKTVSSLENQLLKAQKERKSLSEEQQKSIAKSAAMLRTKNEQVQKLRAFHQAVQAQVEFLPLPPVEYFKIPPVTIVIDKFTERKANNEEWLSSPFYTHHAGYKMLLVVYPNGSKTGHGTHLSMYLHFARGEYDDRLEWPFQGKVTVIILNQQSALANFMKQSTSGHHRWIIDLDKKSNLYMRTKPTDDSYGEGWGYEQLIPHAHLGRYITKDDTLHIRVQNILFLPL